MRVRTKAGALVSSVIIVGVMSFIIGGDGAPVEAHRAPPAAVAPAAGEQPRATSTSQSAAASAARPGASGSAKPARRFTLDGVLFHALLGALTYVGLFLMIHLNLRRLCLAGRWTYAGAGAVASCLAMTATAPWGLLPFLLEEGRLSQLLFMSLGAGAVLGFQYRAHAGLEAEGDDPAALEAALKRTAADDAGDDAPQAPTVLVEAGGAEYFAGPLQVRTSAPVAFVAALLSSGLFGILLAALGMASVLAGHVSAQPNYAMEAELGPAFEAQLPTIAIFGMLAPLPFMGLTLLGHAILRAKDDTSFSAYVLTGVIGAVLVIPLTFAFGLLASVPLALTMATYRNMAGLEPKPVKEDIILNDRRNLVGEDHARRQFGRLVKG